MNYLKRTYKIPIYSGSFIVVICDDDNVHECAKIFKYENEDLKEFDAVVIRDKFSTSIGLPVIFTYKNMSPGIIAHESLHIVNDILRDINHTSSMIHDEPECYLLTWIVNRIWEVKTKFEKQFNVEPKYK